MTSTSITVPALGIDFGTSYSKMAWYNPKTQQAEVLRNYEGTAETPSVVYFGEHDTLVGVAAEQMLGYEQERERVLSSIKRDLLSVPLFALPGGKLVRPVEVAATILHKLKHDAQELHFHQKVSRVVITCPASFGPLERDKIREAAQLAGFQEVELLEEPVAAARAYAELGQRVGDCLLVYDLGGGTFDLAVLAREEQQEAFHLALEPQGLPRCGGDDFDAALYRYCEQLAQEQLGRPISLEGKHDVRFLHACRARKEDLSLRERVLFRDYLEPGPVLFSCQLERSRLEELIRPLVEETVRKTRALLEQAQNEGYAIDTLVLMGGSSRVRLVQRLLEQTLPLQPLQSQWRDVAVALGAAYAAQTRWPPAAQVPMAGDGRQAATPLASKETAQRSTPPARPTGNEQQVTPMERQGLENDYESSLTRQRAPEPQSETVAKQEPKLAAPLPPVPASSAPALKPEALTCLRTLSGHADRVWSVAFSPDGQTLASGSGDQTIKVWNVASGQCLCTLTGHGNRIASVALSPDGQTLASGSADKSIKLWHLSTGECLRTLTGHTDRVWSVALSPNGQTLLSGSADQTIKIWGESGNA